MYGVVAKLTGEQRQAVIITAGLRVARDANLWAVTHSSVARRCVVPTSAATVKHHYATKGDLWRAVIAADDTARLKSQADDLGFK